MGFFARSRSNSLGFRYRPTFEALEGRDCPSTLTLAVAQTGMRNVTLSGHYSDPNPGGVTINFTGVCTGSAVTDANGNYSFNVTATGLGNVTAATRDSGASTQATITDQAPTINNFQAVRVACNTFTISGTVSNAQAAGMTVTLGGLPDMVGCTITVRADGTFSASFDLAKGESGTLTAQTTDPWGLTSALAQTYVMVPSR
jgi:hypothetical protein